jgi:hypothetical protein
MRTPAMVLGALLLTVSCSKAPTPGVVPAPLQSVAQHSEDLYDAARGNDWAAAAAHFDSLQRAASDLPVNGEASGGMKAAVRSQLTALAASLAAQDRLATMRAANEVTRLAAEMTNPYKPAVPTEITLLDYSGRELELWGETGDFAKLDDATARLRRTWNAARGRVEKQPGGVEAAASFEALVARAESPRAAGDYATVATAILDEVDKLEQLFTG